jgi:hypothetical protein
MHGSCRLARLGLAQSRNGSKLSKIVVCSCTQCGTATSCRLGAPVSRQDRNSSGALAAGCISGCCCLVVSVEPYSPWQRLLWLVIVARPTIFPFKVQRESFNLTFMS